MWNRDCLACQLVRLVFIAWWTLAVLFYALLVYNPHSIPFSYRAIPHIHIWLIIHVASAVLALLLGPVILLRKKGDKIHRYLGRAWVFLIMLVALGSFALRRPEGPWCGLSWIHVLSVWTFISCVAAIYFVRKKNIKLHQFFMVGTYIGLVIAGIFALVGPDRLLSRLFWFL